MKKSLRYFSNNFLTMNAVFLAIYIGVTFICWLYRNSTVPSIIEGYASMMPMFAVLGSFLVVLSTKQVFLLALSFGATRKEVYWSMQIYSCFLSPLILTLATFFSHWFLSIYVPQLNLYFSGNILVYILMFVMGFCATQVGLLFTSFNISPVVFGVMLSVVSFVIGLLSVFLTRGDYSLIGHDKLRLILYALVLGVNFILTIIFMAISYKNFKKVVI